MPTIRSPGNGRQQRDLVIWTPFGKPITDLLEYGLSILDLLTKSGYIAFTTSGIIDFSTDAYEIDTMYVWANFDGYQVCASYDTLAIESLLIDEIYDPVNPGTYTWRAVSYTHLTLPTKA